MGDKANKLTKYPLSEAQKVYLYQDFVVMLHPEAGNIPISIYLDKNIDLELLRKALKLEVERNDSLRLCLKMTLSGVRQIFYPERNLGEIPFDDFTGKSEEEFFAYVKKYNSKPLKLFRGEGFRLRFFRAPDGRYGIYGIFAHMVMDATAVLLFYRDLLEVYLALRDGKELPPPLGRFENVLKREYKIYSDKEWMAKTENFYKNYLTEGGPSFYAGVDQMRELKRTREKLRKPDFRAVEIIHPFNDGTKTVKCHVDKELADAMSAFGKENRLTVQSLFQLGYRTHLSKVNEGAEDVCLFVTVSRRATVEDRNSGGSRALAQVLRTIFGRELTFREALKKIDICSLKLYRYPDFPSLAAVQKQAAWDGISPKYTTLPMLFTFFPKELVVLPKGV